MNAGLDFGTSKSSIAVWKDGAPHLLPLEDGNPFIPSTLYTARHHVSTEELDEAELRRRVAEAKGKQTRELRRAREDNRPVRDRNFSNRELENIERGVMRRELAERSQRQFERQGLTHALYADVNVAFGESAIRGHLTDPQAGYFVKSPKSFLGADLKHHHIELFAELITRMLANIKQTAEAQANLAIEHVVLGRPVNFHGTSGEEGNQQALSILQRAGAAAGFEQVEFLYEPIAAALDYERTLHTDQIVLVLDAGGGTTDCSVMKAGPAYRTRSIRDDTILGFSGDRVGGTDLDIKLTMRAIMPHLGKDSLLTTGHPIPSAPYWDSVATNDVNAQTRFASRTMGRTLSELLSLAHDKRKVERLIRVHKGRLSFRLSRSAELAKIHLSGKDSIHLPLRYIDPDLVIPITRSDLEESIGRELARFVSLMKEAVAQAQTTPDVIYVTGGTAKSPVVADFIAREFQGATIIVGDLFGSVTSGLATWASRIYQ